MLQSSPSTEQRHSENSFERVRKLLSWTTTTVFALSFAALLVLSATEYWQPGNSLIHLCDRIWRISGALALTLGSIPILKRSIVRLAGFFGL